MSKRTARKILGNAIPVVVVAILVIAPLVHGYWPVSLIAAGLGGWALWKAWEK